jgi:hypothetical protein
LTERIQSALKALKKTLESSALTRLFADLVELLKRFKADEKGCLDPEKLKEFIRKFRDAIRKKYDELKAKRKTPKGRYSGKLVKVENPDPKADLLAKKIGGESRVKFADDAAGREFDVVSDKYIGQTNEGKQVINQRWRTEAKATFEAALETGKTPYFHFESQPGPDLLRRLNDYAARYGITPVIDISPF